MGISMHVIERAQQKINDNEKFMCNMLIEQHGIFIVIDILLQRELSCHQYIT